MILLALTWLLVCLPKLSTAVCNCNGFKSLQEQFCEAEFVLGVTVLEHEGLGNTGGDRKYMVQVTNIFKGNPVDVDRSYNFLKAAYLYTYATEKLGGILLLPSNHYVVGGEIKGGKNWIGKCCLNYPGYGLPCNATHYVEGCKDCKINHCGPNFCSYGYFTCRYRSDNSYADACKMGPTGCSWTKCDRMKLLSESYENKTPPPPPLYESNVPPPDYDNNPPSPIYDNNVPPPVYEHNPPSPIYEDNTPPPVYESNPPSPIYENNIPAPFIDPYFRKPIPATNNQQPTEQTPTNMVTEVHEDYHYTTQGIHFWYYGDDKK